MKKQLKMFTNISRFFKDIFSRRTQNGQNEVKIAEKTEEFERCVLCGRLTSVRKDTNIDYRDYYEVGIGQTCYECNKKLK